MTDNQTLNEFNEYLIFQGEHIRFTRRLSEFLEVPESGLRFLVYLKINGRAENMTEIGHYYGMVGPNISRTVKKLVNLNLIKMNRKGLSLTAKGNRIMNSLHDAVIAIQTTEKPYEKFISSLE